MVFNPIVMESISGTFLKKKYLAYLALLAVWIVFCYWLYAKELFPRFHGKQDTPGFVYVKDLNLPLAFNWDSDIPLTGNGFKAWIKEIEKEDTIEGIMIIQGYYFRDEEGSIPLDEALAKRRIENVLKLIKVSSNRVMIQVLPQEINADVRTKPFEAINITQMALADIMHVAGDTLELCFPIKDSLNFPPLIVNRLDAWLNRHSGQREGKAFVIGIADGSGIAESADMALDRAIVIQNQMLKNGWKAENIQLSTGQRTSPRAIRNRCAIVFME